jgi:hypothetical protein
LSGGPHNLNDIINAESFFAIEKRLGCRFRRAAAELGYTDEENKIFLIYKEIQMGSGAKLYMRKGFLINEKMRKYFTIYEEAVSHI